MSATAAATDRFRPLWSPARRRVLAVVLVALVVLALIAISFIPVEYPSSTILYKFGADRVLLFAGKITGVVAVGLILVQLALAARLSFFDRIVPQNRLILFHRGLGIVIAVLAVAHPVLVFSTEDVTTIPLDFEYWPEVVGAALLLALCFLAGVTILREPLGLPHGLWKSGHRMGAAAVVAGFSVHVHYVNDGYDSGLPFAALWTATGAAGLAWLWIVGRPLRHPRPHGAASVAMAGRDAVELELEPKDAGLSHAPGQYAYLRFDAAAVSREEHPFTIASGPMDCRLRFTIRCAGDFTSRLPGVQAGETVWVDGPYGQFSYLAAPWASRIVLVAGGVGVTPMLSMLRYMAAQAPAMDDEDSSKVVKNDVPQEVILLWSNRKSEDAVHREELEAIAGTLPRCTIVHTLSRGTADWAESGRLDAEKLHRHVGRWRRDTAAFVCGPPAMMAQAVADLRGLGFPGRAIFTEEFRL